MLVQRACGVALATAVAAASAHGSYFEGFESGLSGLSGNGAPPGYAVALSSGEWYVLNNSSPIGSLGVFEGNTSVFPAFQGTGYAGMNFNNGAGLANLQTYFMAPEVLLENGAVFSFYTRTVDVAFFPDRLRVVMSTNGASVNASDFSTVLLTVNQNLTTSGYPSVWTQFSVTLSGLSSPVAGRLAFLYDVPNGGPSGSNSDYIGIDNVSYVPAPGAIALLGLAGLAGRRRRG